MIPFFSIYEYLEGIVRIKELLPKKSMMILCAAVSDFIPLEVVEHKIHTTSELKLDLTNSPKILGKMVSPDLLCASFKLETDPNRINERMERSINVYDVDMVIGNIWGNKNWIKVRFNPKSMGKKEDKEYDLAGV